MGTLSVWLFLLLHKNKSEWKGKWFSFKIPYLICAIIFSNMLLGPDWQIVSDNGYTLIRQPCQRPLIVSMSQISDVIVWFFQHLHIFLIAFQPSMKIKRSVFSKVFMKVEKSISINNKTKQYIFPSLFCWNIAKGTTDPRVEFIFPK